MINKLGLKAKDQGLICVTKSCMTSSKGLKNIRQALNLSLKCVQQSLSHKWLRTYWDSVCNCFVHCEALQWLR